LDFDLITTCGDSYCLGDETCSSCQNDCGVCTDPPIITITSPEQAKVYDTIKINLITSADQEILIWMYSLDSADPITFSPDITLTLEQGAHEISVIGLSKENYLSGTRTVSFSIDIPEAYCGDGICNNAETCSTCPSDCGTCDTGGSTGGGSNNGGGSSTATVTTTSTTNTENTENNPESSEENIEIQGQGQQGRAGITGAVIGAVGKTGFWVIGIFLVVLIGAAISLKIIKRGKEE